ncbi:hypothetical protein PHYBLDRAFT_165361 [Phycomyces blakesleeanus NRRL 1555(-)]|uniref:Uncharacterized protein n=1 Tax=Phycomyces blakesleeanus (strain ATCC 8743b / DSM 1359 / FGSC 10004 / NBRC 33097 / NRRL 1555) TaxID=763407 RepID=A0A163E5U5_PHYB8|nr:hypothetical protein PHYBLDRAFT_165361 [Phycomyces blakesleeanus NRRL 1555(-)]OAD76860.1 hypothetical protein PHYBLDRAFT_165361 [Phycomyces blakesleeanus NRRL 1555(-)]|eukprot:XP_018294900.1 hypothetical protein PHYBLDRAFT_165361 [Phycomyces blakesleeanus NRRL 1555(-)]
MFDTCGACVCKLQRILQRHRTTGQTKLLKAPYFYNICVTTVYAAIAQLGEPEFVVPNLGWSSFYYNKVKSHYTAVNAQEDITAYKEVLRLTIFRFYGFIKIMSDKLVKLLSFSI